MNFNQQLELFKQYFQQYYYQELNYIEYLFENAGLVKQIAFIILIIIISFFCGHKNAQRNILIDKKLKVKFMDSENKKRKIMKAIKSLQYYQIKIKSYLTIFYVLFTLSIFTFIGLYLASLVPLDLFLDFTNILIAGAIITFAISLHGLKVYFKYKIKKLEIYLRAEKQQENTIETKILTSLGDVLTQKIKDKLLSDENKKINALK